MGIQWTPGQLALHPGPAGQCSAVRWTCPAPGEHEVNATFTGIAGRATTDVHVLHNGKTLYDCGINICDHGNRSSFTGKLTMKAGDRLDFVVGFGNGFYGGDTTALAATVRQSDGRLDDAAAQFTLQENPHGPWTLAAPLAEYQMGLLAATSWLLVRATGAFSGSLTAPLATAVLASVVFWIARSDCSNLLPFLVKGPFSPSVFLVILTAMFFVDLTDWWLRFRRRGR